MKNNDENSQAHLSPIEQQKFADYNYKKIGREKIKTQKQKNINAEMSETFSKSKVLLSKKSSQADFTVGRPVAMMNNFFKKNRRNSQEKFL
jgi:hypothetical protein